MGVDAVILAAGFGTRLAPLTDHTPKPLIEVGGRAVISHLVDRLVPIGDLGRIVVVANACHRAAWANWEARASASATSAGVALEVIDNGVTAVDQRFGAVADLRRAIGHLADDARSGVEVDRVVVLGGDNLIDENLEPHVAAAQTLDVPIVLCRDLGGEVPPGRFGEVTTDADGRVVGFREKPERPRSPLAATCSYVLDRRTLGDIDAYLGVGDPDSPGGFIAWLAGQRVVHARTLVGRYFDIGNHETLAEARAAW